MNLYIERGVRCIMRVFHLRVLGRSALPSELEALSCPFADPPPSNLLWCHLQGGQLLYKTMRSGVTGLVERPREGASKEG